MQPYTAQDYTGDSAAHTLASILGINQCRWFQVQGVTIADTSARVGGSDVNIGGGSPAVTAIGFPIGVGGAQFSPPVSDPLTEVYDLTKWYVVAYTGDVLSIGAVL